MQTGTLAPGGTLVVATDTLAIGTVTTTLIANIPAFNNGTSVVPVSPSAGLPVDLLNGGTVALTAGTAAIGTVAVSGTVPVSGNVTLAAGAAAIGSVTVSNLPVTQTVAGTVEIGSGVAVVGQVDVANFPATQPVSGTVTATGTLTAANVPGTPTAGTATAVVSAGTAVAVFVGPLNYGYIQNPETAADQGIATAEPLYVSPVSAPGSTDGSGNTTTSRLDPGSVWTLPFPIDAGATVYANAASAGHKFTAVKG